MQNLKPTVLLMSFSFSLTDILRKFLPSILTKTFFLHPSENFFSVPQTSTLNSVKTYDRFDIGSSLSKFLGLPPDAVISDMTIIITILAVSEIS